MFASKNTKIPSRLARYLNLHMIRMTTPQGEILHSPGSYKRQAFTSKSSEPVVGASASNPTIDADSDINSLTSNSDSEDSRQATSGTVTASMSNLTPVEELNFIREDRRQTLCHRNPQLKQGQQGQHATDAGGRGGISSANNTTRGNTVKK